MLNIEKKEIKKAAYWQQKMSSSPVFRRADWNSGMSKIISCFISKVKQSYIKLSLRQNPSSNGGFYA